MTSYGQLIRKGWWAILLVLFACAFLLGRHAPDIQVHAGTNVLLDEDDPDLAFYERTRPLWGYDEYAIVCLTRDAWITPEGLAVLGDIAGDLEGLAHTDHLTSILDIPLLRQQPGSAINPANVPNLRSKDLDLDRAREEITQHTQAVENLISADGRSLSVLVHVAVPEKLKELDPTWSRLKAASRSDPDARAEMEALRPAYEQAADELRRRRVDLAAGIRGLIPKWEGKLTEPVRLSGTSIVYADVLDHLRHDLRVFGIAAFVLFLVAFWVIYRRLRFVLLPIVTCLLPVALVVGAMSVLDMRLTVITANLPVILFTLMLPYTVYFVERYRERRLLHPEEDGETSTVAAAKQVWVPCLFSCATTMAGFAALTTSGTLPVYHFGLMMTIGMAVGLVVIFLALPAMSRPLPALRARASAAVQIEPKKIVRLFAALSLKRPGLIVVLAAVTFIVSIWGATRLSAQAKLTAYFKKGTPIYEGLEYIDQRMGGTTPLEVILESEQANFFVTPKGQAALRAVQDYFDLVPETGKIQSLATLVDELRKKNPAAERLMPFLARHPLVRRVTKEYANEDYSISRVVVRLRETVPTLDRSVTLAGLRKHMAARPELEGLKVRETGLFLLYANMLEALMRTQRETFLWVVGAIYLMLLILFRSPLLALLVVLTQVLPAVVMLGLMGWAGITLDLVTVMIASIAMGVGIDAAIQYTVRFRTELETASSHEQALVRSHATTGRAIWVATTVIIAGFCVLTLSDFRPSIYLGLLTAVAMLVSQLAALTILPSIFLLTGYPKVRKRTPDSRRKAV